VEPAIALDNVKGVMIAVRNRYEGIVIEDPAVLDKLIKYLTMVRKGWGE
jgi:hypothetical protein